MVMGKVPEGQKQQQGRTRSGQTTRWWRKGIGTWEGRQRRNTKIEI